MNPANARTPDETFMEEALQMARMGLGRTRPNPAVGCVIVRDGQILARGFHARAGQDHAEIAALKDLAQQGLDPAGCDLYVNLEPCSHHGRTPPCADALVRAGLARVIIGSIDPNPRVSGRGMERLRAAGIEVTTGVHTAACDRLNAPFFKVMREGLPHVLAKFAMSLDGKIATHLGESSWISSPASRESVHELRNQYDAVMVGTTTLLRDDPQLTCRLPGGRHPVRVVLDARLQARPESRVFDQAQDIPTWVFCAPNASPQARERLVARGAQVIEAPLVAGKSWLDVRAVLAEMARREILSVMVEGGGALLGSLFDLGLVDEVLAFVSPKIIGGHEAPGPVGGQGLGHMADVGELVDLEIRQLGVDVAIRGMLPRRPVHTPAPVV